MKKAITNDMDDFISNFASDFNSLRAAHALGAYTAEDGRIQFLRTLEFLLLIHRHFPNCTGGIEGGEDYITFYWFDISAPRDQLEVVFTHNSEKPFMAHVKRKDVFVECKRAETEAKLSSEFWRAIEDWIDEYEREPTMMVPDENGWHVECDFKNKAKNK